ncbi:hypothetical protein [Kitasatospora sp. CB01950]|nr:hypothetical protein [Kitasatospora sp. CB01950]
MRRPDSTGRGVRRPDSTGLGLVLALVAALLPASAGLRIRPPDLASSRS